jgi:glycerol kinase
VILAIDQGTTGTTCLVVDADLRVRGRGYAELRQTFPGPGLVEHDPDEIWTGAVAAAELALRTAGIRASALSAIGITNQRETTVLWEREGGRPLHPAIVWQDRRTAERCRRLPVDLVRERTGLLPDPYFSATKLEWLIEHAAAGRDPAELAFGTIDSWLVWKLTGGSAHLTDVSNASRTMLCRLSTLEWDPGLLELFGVSPALLPRISASSEVVAEGELLGARLPIAGIAGDQQAALFGQGCFRAGEAKATYGTGSFVLVHAGETPPAPPAGGLVTAAVRLAGEAPQYALEGSVFVAGAALQWLRDGLGLLESVEESEALAVSLPDNGGVYFVPALTGLGAPHWAPDARGLITGLTRGTSRAHLVRAALEASAYQVCDVLDALSVELVALRADGGLARNAFAMQFQADLLGLPVEVAAETETTALGAAALAGLAVGVWPGKDDLAERRPEGRRYEPQLAPTERERLRREWSRAVARALL